MTLEGMRIGKGEQELFLLPKMANRHGLVTGATGTGKTVTLQVMAESFSRIGVPVFAADVKGDLTGVSQPGAASPKLQARIDKLGLGDHVLEGSPVPPRSRMGLITDPERQAIVQGSLVYGHYEKAVDRHSAYEMLKARAEREAAEQAARAAAPAPYGYPAPAKGKGSPAKSYPGYPAPAPKKTTARRRDTLAEAMAKSAARTVGSQLGRQILRGVLGSIFGGRR